jgi:imidazolonepropionase-like amidohydrolase
MTAALCLVIALSLAPAMLAAQDALPRQQIPPQGTLAFVDVNVVPMDAERVLANQTVIVRAGRIIAMGNAAGTPVPADAQRIDGRGRYLMPGLAEMHGHVPTAEGVSSHNTLFLYVANGVTTVRGMQGGTYHITLREQLARGEVLGPRFFAAGPQLSANSASTVDAGKNAVQRQKDMGFDLLKIQEGLSREVYDSIVATARALRIPFGGHVPDAVGLWHALRSGQGTIDHLDNYMEAVQAQDFPSDVLQLAPQSRYPDPTARRIAAAAEATRRANVAVVPTMPLWEMLYTPPDSSELVGREDLRYMPRFTVQTWFRDIRNPRIPREQYTSWKATRNAILKALSDAGVRVLLGTDSPQRMSVPGFSIHHEMRSMAVAGMTPYQILRSGTWNVAEHFGLLNESGTVAVGKRADLILLTANPLTDVGNVSRRAGVVVNGRWLEESDIQVRLRRIADGYAAAGG